MSVYEIARKNKGILLDIFFEEFKKEYDGLDNFDEFCHLFFNFLDELLDDRDEIDKVINVMDCLLKSDIQTYIDERVVE